MHKNNLCLKYHNNIDYLLVLSSVYEMNVTGCINYIFYIQSNNQAYILIQFIII